MQLFAQFAQICTFCQLLHLLHTPEHFLQPLPNFHNFAHFAFESICSTSASSSFWSLFFNLMASPSMPVLGASFIFEGNPPFFERISAGDQTDRLQLQIACFLFTVIQYFTDNTLYVDLIWILRLDCKMNSSDWTLIVSTQAWATGLISSYR